jgi:hypothetical protein
VLFGQPEQTDCLPKQMRRLIPTMQLTTRTVVEHQSVAAQETLQMAAGGMALLAPGACTTCLGSTCCSCCCSAAVAS